MIISFLCVKIISFKNTEGDVKNKLAAQKASTVSLSDFLDRKLPKSSVLPKTVQVFISTLCLASEKVGEKERN